MLSNGLPKPSYEFSRSYLREIRKFPDQITRSYLLNLLHKRCKRPYGNHPERVQTRILKSIHFLETVRLKVVAANSGHLLVFEELLKESFARKGERREKFLKPYLIPSSNQIPNSLNYPEKHFPIYPPILHKLITSSITNQLRTIPSQVDLQFISPTSIITNVWSDLPEEFQPDLSHLGKSNGMGIINPSRQINHRNKLKNKWINGLIGPPFLDFKKNDEKKYKEISNSIKNEFGTNLSIKDLNESFKMLKELKSKSILKGNPGTPRYAIQSTSSHPIQLNPIKPIPDKNRIPNKLPSSHPFSPTPITHQTDPIESLLPKRSRLKLKETSINLKNGPRTLTHRFIRRRYQTILNLVPLISFPDELDENCKGKENQIKGKNQKKLKKESKGINRDWITPDSLTGKKVVIKRAGVGLGSGKVGIQKMTHEDLIWL